MPKTGFLKDLPRLWRKSQATQSGVESSPGHPVRVGCPAHNCGGRCLLVAHVQGG
jgi:hypothetical protein